VEEFLCVGREEARGAEGGLLEMDIGEIEFVVEGVEARLGRVADVFVFRISFGVGKGGGIADLKIKFGEEGGAFAAGLGGVGVGGEVVAVQVQGFDGVDEELGIEGRGIVQHQSANVGAAGEVELGLAEPGFFGEQIDGLGDVGEQHARVLREEGIRRERGRQSSPAG